MKGMMQWSGHPLWRRVQGKFERLLARRGLELAPIVHDFDGGYRANAATSRPKLSEYLARLDATTGYADEIESPAALVLNKAVARFVGSARSIINVESESAAFERFVAVDKCLELLANLRDEGLVEWAANASPHDNVRYCPGDTSCILQEYGRFDLALAIDLIDRREDFSGLLDELSQLSDRVIVTASNKARDPQSFGAASPANPERIREWTAGEFYWVLRSRFQHVDLYGMPDPVVPHTVPVGPLCTLSPLIAVCRGV
jgi:hypothetical protein